MASNKNQPSDSNQASKPKKSKAVIILSIILVLAIIAGILAYMVQVQSANKQKKQYEDDKKALQEQLDSTKKELEDKQKELDQKNASAQSTTTKPSAALIENVEAVHNTKNTQPMETYMSSSVNVIIAASECCGNLSASQAVEKMSYLDDHTAPWDCSLPAATVAPWKNGFYKQYFADNYIVCKSKDNYIASFGVSNGKINKMFLAINTDILI